MSTQARRPARALLLLLVMSLGTALGVPAAHAAPVPVDGSVQLPPGATLEDTVVTLLGHDDESGETVEVTSSSVGPDGSFEVLAEPGWYGAHLSGTLESVGGVVTGFSSLTGVQVVEGATSVMSTGLDPLTVQLRDGEGQAAPGSAHLHCEEQDDENHWENLVSTSEVTGSGSVVLYGTAAECRLEVEHRGVTLTRRAYLDPWVDDEITAPLETVSVSGRLTAPAGASLVSGSVTASGRTSDAWEAWSFETVATAGTDGTYELETLPGDVHVAIDVRTSELSLRLERQVSVSGSTVIDGTSPPTVPVTIQLVDEQGRPAQRSLEFRCIESGGPERRDLSASTAANGQVGFTALPEPAMCRVSSPSDFTTAFFTLRPDSDDTYTFDVTTGSLVREGAETADGDGVSATTESFAANGGDGNQDGVLDYEQANVTSLPANGGQPSSRSTYLTLAGPPGTSLVDVTTLDPYDPANGITAPPAGVRLPGGLASFVLEGLTDGETVVVSLYHQVTVSPGSVGYAKYDGQTGQWSLLPSDRVSAPAYNRIDVTLTDGGIGDADGVADGRITDPGGIASVTDSTPPTVTGTATTTPGTGGWYDGDVTVTWTATDDTAAVTAPGDTVVTGEGDDLTATSDQVCDSAGNCAVGVLSGLKIDRTAPEVALVGPEQGASYVLGSVPSASCDASDQLSGLDGACSVTVSGGEANGTGELVATARAVDVAGNEQADSVTYRVIYGFSGFQQPVNDPATAPSLPMSVFKAGSTVTVAFELTRSDGGRVTPGTAPRWVAPVRLARSTAAVNEKAASGRGSSGPSYVRADGRWEYRWSTKGLARGYTYRIGAGLDDGTTRSVTVALR